MDKTSTISLLTTPAWQDYQLLDTGDGQKLERFGSYTFVRPEVQAMWKRNLSDKEWGAADALFQPSSEESGGRWLFKKKIPERWEMTYKFPPAVKAGSETQPIRFWAMTTPGRHLGVFPEVASHWNFIVNTVREADRPVKSLNLFGYTGLASLSAAAAGAQVTHVDASKKSVAWARENQVLSKLQEKPIRWIVDDAFKFVQREARRGVKYDGIILDPPKFGRGPKGEVWEVYKSLPQLLETCASLLNDHPLFLIVTIYAVKASAIHIGQLVADVMQKSGGGVSCGELVTHENSGERSLSQAVFARWQPD